MATYPRPTYTDEELLTLIQLVKDRPCLYNKKDRGYKNKNKEDEWKEIGKVMGWKAIRCKERWRSIRDSYKRNLNHKRNNEQKSSKYEDFPLEFLNGHVTDQSANRRNKHRTGPPENEVTVVKLELPSSSNNSTVSEDFILPDQNEQEIAEPDHSSSKSDTPGQQLVVLPQSNNNRPQLSRMVVVRRTPSAAKPTTSAAVQQPFVVVGNEGLPKTTTTLVMKANASANNQPQFVMMNGLPTTTTSQQPQFVVVGQQQQANNTVKAVASSAPKVKKPKKRKRVVEESDDSGGEHPVDSFFRSMAQTVKKFPPLLVAKAKMEVCRLVTSLECELLMGKADEPALSSSSLDCDSASEPKEDEFLNQDNPESVDWEAVSVSRGDLH